MNERLSSKKILLITNDFLPSRGGIQECVMGIAKSFGEHAVVFAPFYPGYDRRRDGGFRFSVCRAEGLRQDRIVDRMLFLFLRRPLIFLLRTLSAIQRCMMTNPSNIILCGHITNVLVGYFLKKRNKVPLGTMIHGKEILFHGVLKPFKTVFAKFLIGKSDILFMSNSFIEKKLLSMGVSSDKLVRIPFGVNFPNASRIAKIRNKRSRKEILTVGRLVERKGHEVVLDALPEIVKEFPQTKYTIVGKGPMGKKLRGIVEKKKLSNMVEFHGEVDNIADFYSCCDVFVMPSRFIEKKGDVEGFGLVFLEANCFGKPVVGGNSGGISDAVIDGVTGILVNPTDSGEVANAILKLFRDPKLAKKLGEQGRKRVLEEFTWDRAASIIERTMLQHQVKSEK